MYVRAGVKQRDSLVFPFFFFSVVVIVCIIKFNIASVCDVALGCCCCHYLLLLLFVFRDCLPFILCLRNFFRCATFSLSLLSMCGCLRQHPDIYLYFCQFGLMMRFFFSPLFQLSSLPSFLCLCIILASHRIIFTNLKVHSRFTPFRSFC